MHWRVLAVVVLAAMAGCGSVGGLGGDPAPESVTPAPVPTLSPTPEDPRMGIAPGLSARGVFDREFLAQHHVAAATETSYVWTERRSTRFEIENRTTTTEASQRIVVENATTYFREAGQLSVQRSDNFRFFEDYSVYANGTTEFSRWVTAQGGLQYQRSAATNRSLQYAELSVSALYRYLDLDNQSVSRLSVGDGTHYQVTGTRDTMAQYGPVENYSLRAVIRADGFVRSLDVSFTRQHATGGTVFHDYQFRYERVGRATVPHPSWIDGVQEWDDL